MAGLFFQLKIIQMKISIEEKNKCLPHDDDDDVLLKRAITWDSVD